MENIEEAQRELCEFLIDVMPVAWSKICFYSKCTSGSRTTWMAFIEKETGVICTQESFWERYRAYPSPEMETYVKLGKLIKKLYQAYLAKFGEEQIWCTYALTIDEEYHFHVDLGYEMPEGNLVEQHHAVFRNFFHTEYQYLEGKYPY